MKKKNPKFYNKIIFILFIICIGLFVISVIHTQSPTKTIQTKYTPPNPTTKTDKIQNQTNFDSNFTLIAGEQNLNINFKSGQTLYEILISSSETKTLNIKGKMYEGIGFFITSIGELSEGNGKYIMYDINGKEASVGVSAYNPQNGDKVVFSLKKSW